MVRAGEAARKAFRQKGVSVIFQKYKWSTVLKDTVLKVWENIKQETDKKGKYHIFSINTDTVEWGPSHVFKSPYLMAEITSLHTYSPNNESLQNKGATLMSPIQDTEATRP